MTKAVVSAARGRTCVSLMIETDLFQWLHCKAVGEQEATKEWFCFQVYYARTYEMDPRDVSLEINEAVKALYSVRKCLFWIRDESSQS